MALNGNFVSFQSIIESVYSKAGYQTIDWTQIMEVIGETIGLIGALPAYKDVTTNGLNGAPNPLEVTDYRVAIPSDMVELKAARRVILTEETNEDDETEYKISRFLPMVEATDLFYQSIRDMWDETIPAGTYYDIEYDENLEGSPVLVYGPEYRINLEAQYEYKLNDGYIYTNFELGKGFIELTYTAYVTDENGFPMIPDDPKFKEAIKWSIIKHLDYKKWRLGEISDKVFQYSDQQRDWYIAAARSKASIPSLDKMESIKNMFLRSIPNVNAHNSYFKYANVAEQRYNHNTASYRPGFSKLR